LYPFFPVHHQASLLPVVSQKSAEHFQVVNAIYARYFPVDPPARVFVCVPEWPGPSTSKSIAWLWFSFGREESA
jgi:hypothetical protein